MSPSQVLLAWSNGSAHADVEFAKQVLNHLLNSFLTPNQGSENLKWIRSGLGLPQSVQEELYVTACRLFSPSGFHAFVKHCCTPRNSLPYPMHVCLLQVCRYWLRSNKPTAGTSWLGNCPFHPHGWSHFHAACHTGNDDTARCLPLSFILSPYPKSICL